MIDEICSCSCVLKCDANLTCQVTDIYLNCVWILKYVHVEEFQTYNIISDIHFFCT